MIRKANKADIEIISTLAKKLWPNSEYDNLITDFSESLETHKETFFLFEDKIAIGFCSVSLRADYVEGCTSSPTGYLEGIYVEPQYRKNGIGHKLVLAAINWSKEQGCIEFASDVEMHNIESQKFHEAIGMKESNRLVTYIKKI